MWLFDPTPSGYMDDIEAQRKYFDWLGKQIGVLDMSGWYKLTKQSLRSHNGI
jgi:hypothetical protein